MSNLTGLTIPLTVAFVGQFAVGFPLLLPFKALHGPSIFLYQAVSHGKGKYIGGTITAIAALIMVTSIYEAVTLQEELKSSDGKAALLEESLARAQMSIVMCAINVVLAVTFSRLADEVSFHDKLKKSHDALKKQAGQLSQEYNRATELIGQTGDDAPSAAELKQRLAGVLEQSQALQEQVEEANKEKEEAQKESESLRRQYKSLENSYDELANENMQLKGGHKSTDKKAD